METHRQTCQMRGSVEMINILVRDSGESDKVDVECKQCHKLVARHTIAPSGYYHHGNGFESYLRGLNRGDSYESAMEMKDGFAKIQEICLEEF